MPRLDTYHDLVRIALIKDGWKITHDPLTIEFEDLTIYADLGAEKFMAAQKQEKKIAIEIKAFLSPSPVTELERAIGQYYLYSTFLVRQDPKRILYLAIPERIYNNFFQRPSIQLFTALCRRMRTDCSIGTRGLSPLSVVHELEKCCIKERGIIFFIFNPEREEIVLWKD